MLKKTKAGLAESAERFMEDGETVHEVYLSQTFASPFMYLLVFPIALVFVCGPRAVMTTDRNVYVLKRNMWKGKQVDDLLYKASLEEATAKNTMFGLKISGGQALYAFMAEFDDKKAVAERIEKAGGASPALEESKT